MGAIDTQGQVFKRGTATLMARVRGNDAGNITRDDVASIAYSIYRLDEDDVDSRAAVENHDAVDVTVADVIFDALQTDDDRWTVDSTGYNFRHTIPISSYVAFAVAGVHYLVEYTLTMASGQGEKILVRYDLECL